VTKYFHSFFNGERCFKLGASHLEAPTNNCTDVAEKGQHGSFFSTCSLTSKTAGKWNEWM